MKIVGAVLAVALFAGAEAWAWPQVGDMAEYQIQVNSSGQVYNGQYRMKTTAIDVATDALALEITTVFQGATSTKNVSVKLSDMQQVATRVPDIVLRCAEFGGVAEQLATPAGLFATCKMVHDTANDTGFIWYADVIYGWAKQLKKARASNQVTEVVLSSFHAG